MGYVQTTLPLTKELSIENGAHILYFYSDPEAYFQNILSFVLTGIEQGQHVIIIEKDPVVERLQETLCATVPPAQLDCVHFFNNFEFYGLYGDFHFDRILQNLSDLLQPFMAESCSVRLWGQVLWKEQDGVLKKLNTYECEADITISHLGYLTVCAYDGNEVPAVILTEMMKSHSYFMTDRELLHSPLYRSSTHLSTVFPSISVQEHLENEMDLYKQKLDFVHVVSHEVRNPLTVIKAYSSLLRAEERDPERAKRLQAIYDYSVVIDNEISHIISTEQMLSSEAVWKKAVIQPLPLLRDVIEIMDIKARTQNIRLDCDLTRLDKETIISNAMGFKLIVSNILSNAIKYSHEGDEIACNCGVEGSALVIEVRDHGVGMTADQVSRLFHKYEKMNHEASGQGIGLFMVKKLLDHFNGEIAVTSAPNAGSTFTVRLPLT
jgi:signal transduction histidine kinase